MGRPVINNALSSVERVTTIDHLRRKSAMTYLRDRQLPLLLFFALLAMGVLVWQY